MDQPGVDPAAYVKQGAAETPEELAIEQRNAFYESLSIEAKERFLEALRSASDRGLSEEMAWQEAVIAAETAYAHVPEDTLADDPADLADRDLSRPDDIARADDANL